jgi:hypothetical protein
MSEALSMILFLGGFFITYAGLVALIERQWPSKDKMQIGRLGLVPTKAGILFFVWLAIWCLIAGFIASLSR